MSGKTAEELAAEIQELHARLREAEETLRAIREGEVDALVVNEERGDRVYTLKSADRTYRLMVEGMRQGALSLTAEGRILYCNVAFAELLQQPRESVVQTDLAQHVAPGDHALLDALLRRGWSTGSSQGEVSLVAADGRRIPALFALSSLDLGEGVVSLHLVVTDLTEQKRIEELVVSEGEARSANVAKDQFLATLSHELRTPLTPVLAVISKLEHDGRLPEDVRGSLAMVHRNIELEARLIDDLLDLTRVARGKLELDCRAVDLRETLRYAIDTCCAPQIAAGRLQVREELSAADHRVWADPSRLAQVFWNLLNNAVKFMPEGGTITLRTWSEPLPDAPGHTLIVEIADTGIGIHEDLLPRIFSAFDQGAQGMARRYGGLGLGLTISRAIVERHGGSLGAASLGSGQGAVFTVRLPVGPEVAASTGTAAPARRAPAGSAPPSAHILLVEDHADTAEAMAELLCAFGHRVTVAGSVAAALAAVETAEPIDLVISDLGLPDGSGQVLMRQLARRGLRGIALSGYGMEDDVRRSHEAGFARHLTKPIDADAFRAAVEQMLEGQKQGA